ncbi:MAG: sodium:proton antiporter [Clostridia bacterium]|nr:sodium:proton antiporter [Clostridia bacterium]
MNLIHNIPFFSIFLAMFAGIVTILIKDGDKARRLHLSITVVIGIMSFILLMYTYTKEQRFTFMMGHFPSPWGNELKAGPLEAMLALLFSVVMFLSIIGGKHLIKKEILPEKQGFYFIMMNLIFGAMLAIIYTNDLFTAYVFIEINTICSCALIMAKDSGSSIIATIHYLIMSLLGSGFILFSIAMLYSITGQLLMTQLKGSIMVLLSSGEYKFPLTIIIALFTIGIAIKSGLFPFHTMLPGAYDSATTASSAILSGLVLKSYIILLIKMYYCVFTINMIRQMRITNLLFFLGLCGMVIGSLLALKERRIKRELAYSSVAQIGYIYMGIGIGSDLGIEAAVLNIIAHALAKALLFTVVGRMKDVSLSQDFNHCLKCAAHKDPIAGIGFLVGSFSIIGIPLFAGFASKLYLAIASFISPAKMAAAFIIIAASMILNAMYFIPPTIDIWSPVHESDGNYGPRAKVSKSFALSATAFIAINLLVGLNYKYIVHIVDIGIQLMH